MRFQRRGRRTGNAHGESTTREPIDATGARGQEHRVGKLEQHHVVGELRPYAPQQRENERVSRRIVRSVRSAREIDHPIPFASRERLAENGIDRVVGEDAHRPRRDAVHDGHQYDHDDEHRHDPLGAQ